MKIILYTLLFISIFSINGFAQDDDGAGSGLIRERMAEYIQKRLRLTNQEANQFGPVFLNYFNELRKTTQEHKGDQLVMQQKVAELRLNYRNQFKNIVGEKRSNDVFNHERDFIEEVKRLRQERILNRNDNKPNKRGNLPL